MIIEIFLIYKSKINPSQIVVSCFYSPILVDGFTFKINSIPADREHDKILMF